MVDDDDDDEDEKKKAKGRPRIFLFISFWDKRLLINNEIYISALIQGSTSILKATALIITDPNRSKEREKHNMYK